MATFDHIALIFNPESSGDAPQKASELAKQIDMNFDRIGIKATLTPTERPGHAISLAEDIAKSYKRPLIISVSGDGGYNEVINGVMNAKKRTTHTPTVAVLGAGNANDHHRVMHSKPLLDLILEASPRPLDLIRIEASSTESSIDRYAHSYIGFGVTPQVGNDLNKHGKHLIAEIASIIRTYRKYSPFLIERNKQELMLDNLIFANINEMAKFVKLDDTNTPQDGRFEVITLSHRSKLHMLVTPIKAAIVGFKRTPSYSTYSFVVKNKLPIQSDGEVDWLPQNTHVTITSVHHAIDSLF